jgi:hypothetical protein
MTTPMVFEIKFEKSMAFLVLKAANLFMSFSSFDVDYGNDLGVRITVISLASFFEQMYDSRQ